MKRLLPLSIGLLIVVCPLIVKSQPVKNGSGAEHTSIHHHAMTKDSSTTTSFMQEDTLFPLLAFHTELPVLQPEQDSILTGTKQISMKDMQPPKNAYFDDYLLSKSKTRNQNHLDSKTNRAVNLQQNQAAPYAGNQDENYIAPPAMSYLFDAQPYYGNEWYQYAIHNAGTSDTQKFQFDESQNNQVFHFENDSYAFTPLNQIEFASVTLEGNVPIKILQSALTVPFRVLNFENMTTP